MNFKDAAELFETFQRTKKAKTKLGGPSRI